MSLALRNKNCIEVPGYLKGNEKLKAIATEGDKLNEMHKQQKSKLVCRMIKGVIDKERDETRKDIFKAALQMSAHLTFG